MSTFEIAGVPVSISLGEGDGADAIHEQVNQDGAQATVVFKCPWSQRYAVVAGLLGGVRASGSRIVRVLPAAYPPSPNLFCTAIGAIKGIKPMRDDDGTQSGLKGWLVYEWALITATFSRPTWQAIAYPRGGGGQGQSADPSGLLFATTRFKVSAETYALPFGAYYWQGGRHAGEVVDGAAVSEIRPRVEISLTRHLMPSVPLAQAQTLIGGVNDQPWLLADYAFPRGSVLFTGFNSEPKADPATQATAWELELTFLGNTTLDWNQALDPEGTYQYINNAPDGSGAGPFRYVDFSGLLSDDL